MLYLFCFVLYLYNVIVICVCVREAPCTGLEPFVLPFSLNKLIIIIKITFYLAVAGKMGRLT